MEDRPPKAGKLRQDDGRMKPEEMPAAVGGWLPARREDRELRSLKVGGRKARGQRAEVERTPMDEGSDVFALSLK
jgi:hypothetical protein